MKGKEKKTETKTSRKRKKRQWQIRRKRISVKERVLAIMKAQFVSQIWYVQALQVVVYNGHWGSIVSVSSFSPWQHNDMNFKVHPVVKKGLPGLRVTHVWGIGNTLTMVHFANIGCRENFTILICFLLFRNFPCSCRFFHFNI